MRNYGDDYEAPSVISLFESAAIYYNKTQEYMSI